MKNTILLKGALLTLFCFLSFSSFSKIILPEIFSDNMVLQQQTEASIWGKASPNKNVKLITSWDNRTYAIQSDANGRWQVKVKTPLAGGPYSISISDGKELILKNILIGEVWICSGQSNMEMPLAGWGKVIDYEKEIALANYPDIRLLHVRKVNSTQVETELKTELNGWQVCTPATISEFSSVAYFFGRELNTRLNVPIGLINTSWGGTIAEAWASGESLKHMPAFENALQTVKDQAMNETGYQERLTEWQNLIRNADKGLENDVPIWADLDLNDSDWKDMSIPTLWEEAGLPDFDGVVWFRKVIDIPAEWNGNDLLLNLGLIDDNDITYFNGKEIGATAGYTKERIYTIPKKSVKKGKAVITVRVTDTGGGGGIYGEASKIYLALKSKPSDHKLPLAGNWKYKLSVNLLEQPTQPESPNNPNRPTVLYNAMIYPVAPYALRGAIWYQGESNAKRAYQYRELFPLMIRDWRKTWNCDFPFYFVQLANFMEKKAEPQESDWAELREAQLQTLRLNNTGMAVAIDIGDAKDIHPKNKQEVGRRLALIAEANTYQLPVVYSGPIYQNHTIEGDKIRIQFNYAESGLKTNDGKALTGFAIAGPDHRFHWATAVIEGNEVVVRSSYVKFPVAVRYGWADNPDCNLYNRANLPASPFRTDDWRK